MYRNSFIKNFGMKILSQICVDTSDVFSTTQIFGKRERSNKLIFSCDKDEKYKDTDSGIQSAAKKCGCPFKIRSTPAKDGSGWKVDVKCGVHNHDLPDRLEGHSFVGRLTRDEKHHVVDLIKRHVQPRHKLFSLQDRDLENVTWITQIYKHKGMIENEIRGLRSDIQHLFKHIDDADYVY
ncbi:uncharacterized protein LOC127096460 [Lathyrus oleraceus]|uniref:uncharacterized protein LOC127096460 n=1 Tax=Pisum sativum TaxID=3888 RepID=UPI0021CEFFDF|nr:uncharacterized protein LOC127096460 [Pisum sativum]